MGLLDVALAPLRAVLGSAEQEAEHVFPVQDIEAIQERILDTGEAIRNATESIESHVVALESLAKVVPELVTSVEGLTAQLAAITTVLAPVAAVEQDAAKLGHLFGRRHQGDAPPQQQPS
jgi:hypothetical protein